MVLLTQGGLIAYDLGTGEEGWRAGSHGFVVAASTDTVGGGLASVHTRTGERHGAIDDRLRTAPAGAGDTVSAGGDGFVAGYAMDGGTGIGEHRWGDERWRHDSMGRSSPASLSRTERCSPQPRTAMARRRCTASSG